MTYQNLWDLAKLVLRDKFITVSANIKKRERFHIKNLNFYLKRLEKKEETKSKAKRRKEIVMYRV